MAPATKKTKTMPMMVIFLSIDLYYTHEVKNLKTKEITGSSIPNDTGSSGTIAFHAPHPRRCRKLVFGLGEFGSKREKLMI